MPTYCSSDAYTHGSQSHANTRGISRHPMGDHIWPGPQAALLGSSAGVVFRPTMDEENFLNQSLCLELEWMQKKVILGELPEGFQLIIFFLST